MKNNPKALKSIISGHVIVPAEGNHAFITSDVNDLSEYIFIPIHPALSDLRKAIINIVGKLMLIPGDDDMPIEAKCAVYRNTVLKKEDFIWVEQAGCWAYYPKP